MKNNLFDFATSELSQDAVICWCLNWFNDNSRPKLKEMAVALIRKMAGDDVDVRSVEIFRQYSRKVKMKDIEKKAVKEITVKVDVLAIINHSIGLIIEDKTFSTVHSDQIYRYADGIRQILEDNENKLPYKENKYACDRDKIRTVFWKTGFHYDYDQVVTADVKLNGEELLEILLRCSGESEILDDYLDFLSRSLKWYEKNGDFTDLQLLETWQYPQYRLMREFFPAERWTKVPDSGYELYQVYHGSSFGRPWTEMAVLYSRYPGTKDKEGKWEFFWRIDSDNDGPYLSLRFYEGGLNKSNKERHVQKYGECKKLMEQLIGEKAPGLSWYPGYRGNYKEASIFHLCLKDYLSDWNGKGKEIVETIRIINDTFLERMNTLR